MSFNEINEFLDISTEFLQFLVLWMIVFLLVYSSNACINIKRGLKKE